MRLGFHGIFATRDMETSITKAGCMGDAHIDPISIPSSWLRMSEEFIDDDIRIAEIVMEWVKSPSQDEWVVEGILPFNRFTMPEFHARKKDDEMVHAKVVSGWSGKRLRMFETLVYGKMGPYQTGDYAKAALAAVVAFPSQEEDDISQVPYFPTSVHQVERISREGPRDDLLGRLRMQATQARMTADTLEQAIVLLEKTLSQNEYDVFPRSIDILHDDCLCDHCKIRRAKIEYVQSPAQDKGYAVCVTCNTKMLQCGEMKIKLHLK